jgi:hypothetical protein
MGALVNREWVVIAFLLSMIWLPSVVAQSNGRFQEAPESLFQFDIGDAEVELFLSGNWLARSYFGATWQFPVGSTDTNAPLYSLPGISSSIPIENRVDLTLSLWLLNQYFFEAGINDELEDSTFLLGYIGTPGDLVQSVLIGNRSIEIGAYPYLGFGDSVGSLGGQDPGASVLIETERSAHEAMIRLSPGSNQELLWSNGTIITEVSQPATDYVRSRFFVLPDGNITGLRIFRETSAGGFAASDGRRYQEVTPDQVAGYSLSAGTISFFEEQDRRVLIYYEAGGTAVGSPTLGRSSFFGLSDDLAPASSLVRDFSFYDANEQADYLAFLSAQPAGSVPPYAGPLTVDEVYVSLDGVDALVLHQPGRLSPFERLSHYDYTGSAEAWRIESRSGLTVEESLVFTSNSLSSVVILGDSTNSPRAFENRYPLASSLVSAPQPAMYPPSARPGDAYQLVREQRLSSDQIVLPSSTVPGSIRVRRNGLPETAFVLEDSGALSFAIPLTRQDRVEVTYRVSDGDGTDALIGFGNRFEPAPGISVEAALGARWSIGAGDYSTIAGQNSGYMILSAGIAADQDSGIGDYFTASARGAVSFSTADTTGVLRLESMNEGLSEVPFSPYRIFPSPLPSPALTAQLSKRGVLRYRDLYVTDGLGNRDLLAYEFRDTVGAEPYEAGGRAGPYPARVSSSVYTGTAMVLEYEMEGDTESWVGGQMVMPEGIDLSQAVRIRIPVRHEPAAGGGVDIAVEFGLLDEDNDGDGILDSGSGTLPFNDANRGIELASGTMNPPVLRYTEDKNGNGILDSNLPDRTVTRSVAPTADAWQTVEFFLTADEAARLLSTRAISVVVQPDADDAVPRTGTLAIGAPSIDATPLQHKLTGAGTVRTYSQPDGFDEEPLENAFPELSSSILRDDAGGSHLAVEWDSLASDSIVLSRATSIPVSDYETLRVYVRRTFSGIPILALRATSNESVLAERAYAIDRDGWQELEVALPSGSQLITAIEIIIEGENNGSLLIDEIGLWRPRGAVGAGGELEAVLTPDLTLRLGDIELLSDIRVQQNLTGQTARFVPGGSSTPGIFSQSLVSARLLEASTLLELDFASEDGVRGLSVAHRFERPLFGWLMLSDSFRTSYGALGETWSHQASIRVQPNGSATAEATIAEQNGEELQRSWTLSVSDSQVSGLPLSALISTMFDETSSAATLEQYGDRWVQGYSGILGIADPATRAVTARAEAALSSSPIGIESILDFSSNSDRSKDVTEHTVFGSVEIPFEVGRNSQVTVSMSRTGVVLTDSHPAATATDQYGELVRVPASLPIAFLHAPVYELIDPEFDTRFASHSAGSTLARYEPAMELAFRSPPRSSLFSLIIPSSASIAVRRTGNRVADAVRSAYSGELQTTFVSINQFGRMGIVPLFRFYDSDEFQTRLLVATDESTDNTWQHELQIDQQTLLLWNNGNRLESVFTLDLAFGRQSTHTLLATIEYDWRSHERGRPAAGLIPSDVAIRQRERITAQVENGARSISSLGLFHETLFEIDENSSVSVFAGLSTGRVFAPTEALLVGFEAGVSGSLRF